MVVSDDLYYKCRGDTCDNPVRLAGCKYCPDCYVSYSHVDDLLRENRELKKKVEGLSAKPALPSDDEKRFVIQTLCFFRSAILSKEDWTGSCDSSFDKAIEILEKWGNGCE